MLNRRDFIQHVAVAGLGCSIPRTLFSADSTGAEKLSPRWLELVPPESIGMASGVLAQIDEIIERTIAIGHTPGAVVAIGRGNKMCFLRGYGHRQFYPEKEKITLDTLFDLASVTKVACTATALAMVMDQGKVSPDDLVTKFFPEFGIKGKERITVHHCCTHTSGIGEYATRTVGTREDLWKLLCDVELRFPVGEKFEYRDNNTLVLGHIVEKVSGQNLRDFTIQNIYEPLGMLDTMHNPDEEHRRRAAATETRGDVWFKGVVNDYRAYFLGGVAGHSGLFSTAPDLAILSALWLGKGTYVTREGRRVRLFSPEMCERVMAPQFVSTGVRGLNWDKRSGAKNRPWNMTPAAVGHGGWTGTSIWLDPKLDLFVVVLGNRRHPFGKTPNIYPAAAQVGVIAVNALRPERHRSAMRPALIPVTTKSWAGRKIGLIVSRGEVDAPRGWVSQLQRAGSDIVAVYVIDERATTPANDTFQRVPDPLETHAPTGAPVYALNGICPRILPPMLRGADTLVFGARVPAGSSEEAAWFITSILGHTLQSAADHRLRYGVVDHPNSWEKKRIEPADFEDRLKPFGSYYRAARSRGLTFGELSAMISEDQALGLNIEVVPGA